MRVVLLALAAFLVALPFALLLAQVLRGGPVTSWDVEVAERIHSRVVDWGWLIAGARALSFLGWPLWLGLVVVVAAAVVWVRTHRRRPVMFLLVTSAVGGTVNSSVKLLVARPRPDITDPLADAFGRSFPSGHAFGSVVVYGAVLMLLITLVDRAARPFVIGGYALLVVGIGLSRMALGVHYVSDIMAGWVLGFAWLSAATAVFSTWRVEEGDEPVHVLEGAEPEVADEL